MGLTPFAISPGLEQVVDERFGAPVARLASVVSAARSLVGFEAMARDLVA